MPALLDSLWQRPDIKLCVHCGVGHPDGIKIEQRANNFDYVRLDNQSAAPADGKCDPAGPATLETCINLPMVLRRLQQRFGTASGGPDDITITASTDAGRYLCEFTYYYSLHLFRAPVVFVHVPPFSATFTMELLRSRLVGILEAVQEVIAAPLPGLLRPKVPCPPRLAALLSLSAHLSICRFMCLSICLSVSLSLSVGLSCPFVFLLLLPPSLTIAPTVTLHQTTAARLLFLSRSLFVCPGHPLTGRWA